MSGKSGLVARRYAAALLDMAVEKGNLETIQKDLGGLKRMIDSSADLGQLLKNPLIGRDQQQRAILAIAGKTGLNALTQNFLGVLTQNRRLGELADVIAAFESEAARRRGEVKAKVETAYALSPAQTRALQDELSKAMGSHVTLDVLVNKDLLGGMIVTVGSRMIDDSVRRKLEKLQRAMNSSDATANQNITEQQQKEVG